MAAAPPPPPLRSFWLARIVYLRAVAAIYFVAFLIAYDQNKELVGDEGLLPMRLYLRSMKPRLHDAPSPLERAAAVPTILWWFEPWNDIDWVLDAIAGVGMVVSAAVFITGASNAPAMAALWAFYHSLVNVGQRWYEFGWESQLLETGFLAIWCVPVWTWRALPEGTPPSAVVVWAHRWLIMRIMLGAGLIKVRGDPCWRDFTCMDYFYETAPNPNPLSYYAHHMPGAWHKLEVLGNHIVELVLPWLTIIPWRRGWLFNGASQIVFQAILIATGNLSFLNWLTIIPSLWYFDDAIWETVFPAAAVGRVRALNTVYNRAVYLPVWKHEHSMAGTRGGDATMGAREGGKGIDGSSSSSIDTATPRGGPSEDAPSSPRPRLSRSALLRASVHLVLACGLVWLSLPIVNNLVSPHQRMNSSFGPLRLVNTYGAFGSVTKERTEVVLEGTHSSNPRAHDAEWLEYEFQCKPGDVTRRPCLISPYHYRLDWLMWFAAFQSYQHNPWLLHFVGKLLMNDAGAARLLAVNPFGSTAPPAFIRAVHYRYTFAPAPFGNATAGSAWWVRERVGEYMPPVHRRALDRVYQQFGWEDARVP